MLIPEPIKSIKKLFLSYHKMRLSPCRKKVLMMMKAAKLGWAGAVKNGGSQMALVLSAREVGRGVNVVSVTRSLIMIMLL